MRQLTLYRRHKFVLDFNCIGATNRTRQEIECLHLRNFLPNVAYIIEYICSACTPWPLSTMQCTPCCHWMTEVICHNRGDMGRAPVPISQAAPTHLLAHTGLAGWGALKYSSTSHVSQSQSRFLCRWWNTKIDFVDPNEFTVFATYNIVSLNGRQWFRNWSTRAMR